MTDRRAPGTSLKLAGTYISDNKKWQFIATDAWYNYGNALIGENTNEWDLDGSYRFSAVPAHGRYRGLLLRDRYMQRTQNNTYCGTVNSNSCAPGATPTSLLGGTPLFKYNRVQVEYDF